MREEDVIVFEGVTEEEYELFENSFACQACSWVAFEIYKVFGDRMRQYSTFPGCAFNITETKNSKRSVFVSINPVSETEVLVECEKMEPSKMVLPLEKAVELVVECFGDK